MEGSSRGQLLIGADVSTSRLFVKLPTVSFSCVSVIKVCPAAMSAQLFTSSTLAGHNAHSKMHRPSLTCQARQAPAARFGASHSQLLGSRLGSHSFAGLILPTGCCFIRHGGQESLPRSVSGVAGKQLVALTPRSRQIACGATGVQANLFSRFFRVIRSYANSVGMAFRRPHLLSQFEHCCLT